MKFEEYLRYERYPEWAKHYLDFDALNDLLAQLEDKLVFTPERGGKEGTSLNMGTSLSTPPPTNGAGMPVERPENVLTHDTFFRAIEQQMKKIDVFTQQQVSEIRTILSDMGSSPSKWRSKRLTLTRVQSCADKFLRLEKFVNLNITGFHLVLTEHDARLPSTPCKAFYVARLHEQPWVRGDHSDIIVAMSKIFHTLREEDKDVNEDLVPPSADNYYHSTRRYWVKTENVSALKYEILQHLPVHIHRTRVGQTDSQLINSIYLDNFNMELYQGQLQKSHGAVSLRLRWHGTAIPQQINIERNTRIDDSYSNVCRREMFTLHESEVLPLLQNTLDIDKEQQNLRRRHATEESVGEWRDLVNEVMQIANSKLLIPTMRTQYMRTNFQEPSDNSIRITLDSSICMLNERTSTTICGDTWFREPATKISSTEITHFPHSLLEIKLRFADESDTPAWIRKLVKSGKLVDMTGFSKYIHGCAVLMPQDVSGLPSWINDESLTDSIVFSGAAGMLRRNHPSLKTSTAAATDDEEEEGDERLNSSFVQYGAHWNETTPVRGGTGSNPIVARANNNSKARDYRTPATRRGVMQPINKNLFLETKSQKADSSKDSGKSARPAATTDKTTRDVYDINQEYYKEEEVEWSDFAVSEMYLQEAMYETYHHWNEEECCFDWNSNSDAPDHLVILPVDSKIFLANERTFMSWMNMAITLTTTSFGVLALMPHQSQSEYFAMLMMPVALLFTLYALWTTLWRTHKINSSAVYKWDDPYGPIFLVSCLMLALTIEFTITFWDAVARRHE